MKTKILTAVIALAAFSAPIALADDPLGAVKADLSKLQADFKSAHDTLMADAQKLKSDAALVKPGNKDQAKAALQADWQQFKSDFHAKHSLLQADWQQLHRDLAAARAANGGKKTEVQALKQQLKQMRQSFVAGRAEVHQAVQAAKQAIAAARAAGAPISAADAGRVSDGNLVPPTNP